MLGKNTIIFGRNGSGKSTFSEFLRLLSKNDFNVGPLRGSYYDCGTNKVRNGNVPSNVVDEIHVFNRFYVEANLGQFLDGEKHSEPIVVLGEGNVSVKREIKGVEKELEQNEVRKNWAKNKLSEYSASKKSVIDSLKSTIIENLKDIDGSVYNSARFTITKVENLLLGAESRNLSKIEFQQRISGAGEETKLTIAPVSVPVFDFKDCHEKILAVTNEDVAYIALDSLVGEPGLATWVEQGIEFHKVGDTCSFCDNGSFTTQRLDELKNHFSDAVQRLRQAAQRIRDDVCEAKAAVKNTSWIPETSKFLNSYEEEYQQVVIKVRNQIAEQIKWFDSAVELLNSIVADPIGHSRNVENLFNLPNSSSFDDISNLVNKNNSSCKDQSSKRAEAIRDIELHLTSQVRAEYDNAVRKQESSKRLIGLLNNRYLAKREQIASLRSRLSNTSAMASLIDTDLSTVFGHDHLKVEVNSDNTGYTISRRGEIAVNLSEGERHSIALLYFLRTLERTGVSPSDDIVVVDDPVTSLDRDALFAAHSLLATRLSEFGQTILLTHDFELFRLAVGSHKSGFEQSQKKINEGDTEEMNFASVKFLEIVASRLEASKDRLSSLRDLPTTLLSHPSEYHYLFWCVTSALTSSDESTIPLLGNAARRLLEGFISFKAPNGNTFQDKVNITAQLAVPEGEHLPAAMAGVKERIVKFAHGTSHRAEPIPTTGLDFMAIRDELRNVLKFIQLCDRLHFERMLKAVKIDQCAIEFDMDQNEASIDSKSLHLFGWLPSNQNLIYSEVLRPNISAYGMDLRKGPAEDIASIPSTQNPGLWIFRSVVNGTCSAHVSRSKSARNLLINDKPAGEWDFACYLSGQGADIWRPQDLHYLETSIRMRPELLNFDTILDGPVSVTLPNVSPDKLSSYQKALGTISLALGVMLNLVESD